MMAITWCRGLRAKRNRRSPKAAPVEWTLLTSVNQTGAGGLFQRRGQRFVFRAIGAANRADPVQVILRLIAVALFDLPQSVILPGPHMIRVGLQRALIPDLRDLVVAELAVGVADQIGNISAVLMAERLQLIDGGGIVAPFINRRIGRAVAIEEGRILDAGILLAGFLLLLLGCL